MCCSHKTFIIMKPLPCTAICISNCKYIWKGKQLKTWVSAIQIEEKCVNGILATQIIMNSHALRQYDSCGLISLEPYTLTCVLFVFQCCDSGPLGYSNLRCWAGGDINGFLFYSQHFFSTVNPGPSANTPCIETSQLEKILRRREIKRNQDK